jgi:TPR repeat protein
LAVVSAVLLFCTVAPSSAASLAQVEKRAAGGDAQSQYLLGLVYQKGDIVRQDHRKAAGYFSQAAEQGHADARYQLACCYFAGAGVEQDNAKARSLLTSSADGGSVEAQYHLAGTYARGKGGVKKNYRKAAYWYDKAARQGHAEAKIHLEKLCAVRPSVCEGLR